MNEGKFYFDSMNPKHGITPTTDDYACIVDILGCAGHINKATNLINKMPINLTTTIWEALLGFCRVHGNMDVGKHAAEHLFKLEPHDVGPHVFLSNICAASSRWDDAAKVRRVSPNISIKVLDYGKWFFQIHKTLNKFSCFVSLNLFLTFYNYSVSWTVHDFIYW